MARRSKPSDPERLRSELVQLLQNFAAEIAGDDLRRKVRALIPAFYGLRDLGSSLIPRSEAGSGRDRIEAYLRRYPFTVIDGEELMVIAGIDDWARRVRELRVNFGWWISTGVSFAAIAEEQPEDIPAMKDVLGVDPARIRPDQYVLMNVEPDRDAAYRWNMLNEIRKKKASVADKILEYFRRNVGKQIPGEELAYLAKNRKEWARRVRELRTEAGWPVSTRNSGRDDLPVGVYVLEEDDQAFEHDRGIPDEVRVAVLQRDRSSCTDCGWNRMLLTPDDPRKRIELHHVQHHADGGPNTVENLITLCNVHHIEAHRRSGTDR